MNSQPGQADAAMQPEANAFTYNDPTPAKSSIRLTDVIALLRRQQWLIAGFVVAGPMAAVALTAMTPAVYQGVLTLKIDNERAKIVEGQDLVDPIVSLGDTGRYLATLSKLASSRSLAMSVLDSLSLAKDDSFAVAMGATPVSADLPAAQRANARREQALKLLTDNVAMLAPGDSRLATIAFNSRNAALAAQIANAYGERFLSQNIQQQTTANTYATKVLRSQVEETRAELRDAEMKAIEYARESNLIDAGDAASGADNGSGNGKESGGAKSITTASLVAMNATYNAARAARIAVEQRWRTAAASNGLDIPEARDNGRIQGLIQQRDQAAARLALLRQRYVLSQPDVQEAMEQVNVLDSQLAAAIRSVKASIHAEYVTALEQERQLGEAKEELSSDTLGEQQKRVQLNLIARDADTLRQQLRDLLTRLNQVTSAADITTNNMVIVDRAEVPNAPISPNLIKNLLLGILAGVGLGFALAVLREMIDDTLHTPDDVEAKLQIPLLGLTPWVGDAIDEELKRPLSGLREAYHSIRASVDFASGGARNKILLVTSSASDEGKSTASLAIAQDFARIGRKVLLVDADMRRPSLYRRFDLDSDHPGLTDVVLGAKDFASAKYEDEELGLTFLPMGTLPANPSPLISSEAMANRFAKLREDFDVVIIDSPPVMGLADAPLLSRFCDGVIFVAEASRAHHGQIKTAIRRMRNHGAVILGAVVSKFDAHSAGYGKYSHYYPYYEYYQYSYSANNKTT